MCWIDLYVCVFTLVLLSRLARWKVSWFNVPWSMSSSGVCCGMIIEICVMAFSGMSGRLVRSLSSISL